MENDTLHRLRVNAILRQLRFMQADSLCVWLCEHAGQFNAAETEALALHLADLTPWNRGRAA